MDLIMIITGNILDRKLPKISRINSQTSGKLFFLFWWLHEKFSRDFEIVSFRLKGLLLFRVLFDCAADVKVFLCMEIL